MGQGPLQAQDTNKLTNISLKKLRKEVSGNLAKELLSAAQLSTPASQQPAHDS